MPRVSPPTVAVSTKESFSQWLLDSRLGGKEGIQPSWSAAGGKGKKDQKRVKRRSKDICNSTGNRTLSTTKFSFD